jgi:2-methylcitrate dehydratase PrpD
MIEVTRILAGYVAGSKRTDIPERVWTEAHRTFVNYFGCVLSGSTDIAVEKARVAMASFAGRPEATVLGKNARYDVATVAFLNTFSNFIHSYNDTHLATVAHPTGAVASALLAHAERSPMSGEQFLHAMIIGVEIACRIGNMLAAPPARAHHGLSTAGFTSVFGATSAIGIVLGLNEQQMVWAFGNAVAQAAGVRSTHGSMASHVIPAHQSRNGIYAAYLAAQDFTCSEKSIEGPKGLTEVFTLASHHEHAVDRLGLHYEFLKNAYKPFPCGIVNHAAIDACLRLRAMPGFRGDAVERIDLRVNPICMKLADRPMPQNRLQALVSVQHWAAASLVEGAATLDQGSSRCVEDPAVVAMRGKVNAVADEAVGPESAVVVATFSDGSTLASEVEHCIGSHERPMTDAELDDKFLRQTMMVLPEPEAQRLLAACRTVSAFADVADIARQFFPVPAAVVA